MVRLESPPAIGVAGTTASMAERSQWRSAALDDLVAALAAPGPAPAAGVAAAATCAFAAALVELALGEDDPGADRAAELRDRALAALDRDEAAFGALASAAASPGEAEVAEARRGASDPPLAVAVAAAELAELADGAAERTPEARRGDAAAAARLARGAGLAAVALIEANLGTTSGETQLERARELAALLGRKPR